MNNRMMSENPPILLKGLIKKKSVHFQIESLRTKFKRGLLPISIIDKMIYHLIILLSECEKRNKTLLTNITLDTIYVKANDQLDPHVFIAEEDQIFSPFNPQKTALQVLKNICIHIFKLGNQIGTNNYYQKNKTLDEILEYLVRKIFEIPQEREFYFVTTEEILEKIYNIKKETQIYQAPKISLVLTVKTPYYINCERDIIALKWTKNPNEEQDQFYEYREINLMEQIVDCKNCAKLYGYSKFGRECFFFLRYYDITLENLANKIGQNQDVTQKQYAHLFTQIALAVNDLHSKGIIHRDLKPENIMFEYQNESIENMICVLIDFDRSKGSTSGNDQGPSNYEGTIAFQPPEGTQEVYDASYDIWQLGFIMLCVLLRKKNSAYKNIFKPIDQEKYLEIMDPFFNSAKGKFSSWCPLISQMIEYQKERRPTLEQVIKALSKLNQ